MNAVLKPVVFLLLAIMVSTAVCAQYEESRFSFGLSFGPGVKGRIGGSNGLKYGPWGEFSLGMFVAYGGINPTAMKTRIHAQFIRDDLYIRTGQGIGYLYESEGFLLNPEIVLPIRNTYGDGSIELLFGIGGQYTVGRSLSIRNFTGTFGGTFMDELTDTFNRAQRNLLPFVTAGIGIKYHRRASLTIRLRQDVQNAFDGVGDVTLFTSTGAKPVKLSALPTRLLIGFVIRLGKMPDDY